MSYRRFRIAIILTALICILCSAGTATPRIDPLDQQNIIMMKDVRPGMKGYGLTVFRGTKPEKFGVVVLGTLKKFYFGSDVVLVKLSGGPMTSRGANLIEGMSGSPIYINGKLLGAFAFGYPFGKEPMGMVTPIENMLDAWDPSLPTKPSSFYPMMTGSLGDPIPLGANNYDKVTIDWGQEMDAGNDTLVFRPLATPVFVSGMSPRILAWLTDELKPLNLHPIAGPGLATDKAQLSPDLQPGCAIGASFVTGDIDMTGIGTLTYRRGNNIVAFGHPMFTTPMMNGLGPIQAALTTAYVYDVYPSLQVSSKIAAPIKTVGTVNQDRPWSIGATIGKPPEMIPVTVHIDDQSLGRKKDFHVRVINNPLMTSTLIVGAAAEAVFDMRGSPADATATVKFEVNADEVGTITRENRYFDPVSIDMASITELHQILSLLQMNSFYPVGVKSVNVTVSIVPKHQTAKLERIFLTESKFKPGDTIQIGAVLKPFKGDRVTRMISLQLPNNTPDGRLTVEVYGGGTGRGMMISPSSDSSSQSLSVGSSISTHAPSLENLQQAIKKFLERERNDDLVARITLPQSAPMIAGEKFAGLPPSMLETMKSTKATAFGTEHEEIKKATPSEWVIYGSQRVTITVAREQKAEKKSGAKKVSDSSATPPSEPDTSGDTIDDGSGDTGDEGGDILLDAFQAELPAPPKTDQPDSPKPPAAVEAPGAAQEEGAPAVETTEVKATAPPTIDEKPVGRVPTIWKQTTQADFLAGTFKNTAATTGDLITPAGGLKSLYESTETYVWQLLPDGKGNVYAATGNHGILYKIAANGTATAIYTSPQLEITSLAMDPNGVLYAGTSPNGIVYKIEQDGKKVSTLLDADEKYIVALALDSKGNLYAATGDKCKVYRISPDGKSEVVLDSSEHHALTLAIDKDDNLYVGTAINGIIYKIPSGGKPTVIYDAAEDSITALAVDSKGVLYAGTSPKGVVYKLAPGASPKVLYDKADKGIVGIACAENGYVYAASSASVYMCASEDSICKLENEHDLQFQSLALQNGVLYAGTGSIGSVYSADVGKATQGTYESPVHDCTLPSNWGTIDWVADAPQGASVTLQTRTGFVAEPDSTWSDWSAPLSTSGADIVSPPGRYIQYRATLDGSNAKLKDVSAAYLPANQAPKVTLTSPKGGERWAGRKMVRWTGADPDKDNLSYELFYSSDSGTTWQPLKDKIQPAPTPENPGAKPEGKPKPKGDQAPAGEAVTLRAPDPQQMLAEMAAELDKHPEIPQDVKDKLMSEAPGIIQDQQDQAAADDQSQSAAEAPPDQKPEGSSSKQTSLSWDTPKYADGTYVVKVVCSDKEANPTGALTDEVISEPIVICNKPPKVSVFRKTITVQADKSVTLEGFALQDLIGLAGVQYRIGTGDWASAAASDGIFDSGFESFTIRTDPLDKGDYTIEVKAINEAGRSATTKVAVKVQ